MLKINKKIYIASIFMLIGVFLGQDIAYSLSDSSTLRPPSHFSKSTEEFIEKPARHYVRRKYLKRIIVDRATGTVEKSAIYLHLKELEKLDGKTIKNIRLNGSGELVIAGKHCARFSKYSNHQIEIDVDQGVITEIRIYDEDGNLIRDEQDSNPDRKAGHYKYAVIIDRKTDKYEDSFSMALSPKRFENLDGKTIKYFRLANEGNLSIGGQGRVARFAKYPNHQVEIDVDQGVITEVRIYDEKGNLIKDEKSPDPDIRAGHHKFSVIVDRHTDKYKNSFFANLESKKLKKLDNATIKYFRLDLMGILSVGGGVKGRFAKYPNHQVEIDIDQGVITEVRIYDEKGNLIKDEKSPDPDIRAGHHKFSVIVDRKTGKYEDSFLEILGPKRVNALDGKTIKHVRLTTHGSLAIGGKHRTAFTKYPNHQVEIDVDQGVITEVRIYDEKGNLIKDEKSPDPDIRAGHHKFSVIVDRKTGKYEDSFGRELSSEKLGNLDGKTIKHFRLDQWGNLLLAGRLRGQFSKYPNHQAEIAIDQGLVTEVRIYDEKGSLIKDEQNSNPDLRKGHYKFSVIVDRKTGKHEYSFRGQLSSKRFKNLDGKTIKHFRLDKWGNVSIGGKIKGGFSNYPNHKSEIDVDHGIVTEVRIYDEKGNLIKDEQNSNPDIRKGHYKFSVIVDRKTGGYEYSFWDQLVMKRLKKLDGKTIKYFRLTAKGGLIIGGKHWAAFTKYPNHEIEIDIDQGVVSKVRIYDDEGKEIKSSSFKKLIIEGEYNALFSFRNNYIRSKIFAMLKKIKKSKILWGKISDWNAIKLKHERFSEYFDFTSVGDFRGKDLVIHFENGEPVRFDIEQSKDVIVSISDRDIRRESGWFQYPLAFERTGKDEREKILSEDRLMEGVMFNLLRGEIEKVLIKNDCHDVEKWLLILWELGETDDTEEATREEIVAKQNDVSAREILDVISILSRDKEIRGFSLKEMPFEKPLPGQLDQLKSIDPQIGTGL